jgi:hypothetical protein
MLGKKPNTKKRRAINPPFSYYGFTDFGTSLLVAPLAERSIIFHALKMPPAVVKTRSLFLFDLLVRGESLEPYYSKNKGDQYIEFPDERTYYDKVDRSWKTKLVSN